MLQLRPKQPYGHRPTGKSPDTLLDQSGHRTVSTQLIVSLSCFKTSHVFVWWMYGRGGEIKTIDWREEKNKKTFFIGKNVLKNRKKIIIKPYVIAGTYGSRIAGDDVLFRNRSVYQLSNGRRSDIRSCRPASRSSRTCRASRNRRRWRISGMRHTDMRHSGPGKRGSRPGTRRKSLRPGTRPWGRRSTSKSTRPEPGRSKSRPLKANKY